jgi:steroid delta-isomerase-like uncharacterized protein
MADNAALARRWFEEVWNQNRQQTIHELGSPDVILHGLGEDGRPRVGLDHFKDFFRLFRESLSDIRVTVHDVIAQGDQTATRLTLEGIHAGHGFGIPSTGRAVKITGIVWVRWQDGKVAEGWNEFDAAGLMKQIAGPAVAGPVAVKA